MVEGSSIGRQFIESQDRLRGGPDEALVTIDYTADMNGIHMDLATHKEFTARLYEAFPDLQQIVDSVDIAPVAERVHLRLVGTHNGDFLGLAPTGKSIEVSADVILMIEDGKVESVFGSWDQAGLLQQLGVD